MIPPSRPPQTSRPPQNSPVQKQVLTPDVPAFPPTVSGPAGKPSTLPDRVQLAAAELSPGVIRRTAVSVASAVTTGCALVQLVSDSGTLKETGTLTNGTLNVLDPGGSLLAPAAVSWWLWLAVAALWLGYAIYQWLPRQQLNPRHDQLGWVILAAEVSALAWLVAVSAASAAGVLAVAVMQMAIGLTAVHLINRQPAGSSVEGLLTNVALGWFLALGVLSLTTALAFLLTRADTDLGSWGGTAWSLAGLAVVTVGVTMVCMTDRGHLPVGLAVGAGLAGVAVERLAGTPESAVVAAAAAGAAFLVTVSAGSRRHQADRERRLIARSNARSSNHGGSRSSSHGGATME